MGIDGGNFLSGGGTAYEQGRKQRRADDRSKNGDKHGDPFHDLVKEAAAGEGATGSRDVVRLELTGGSRPTSFRKGFFKKIPNNLLRNHHLL
jgi:hypothetical protein